MSVIFLQTVKKIQVLIDPIIQFESSDWNYYTMTSTWETKDLSSDDETRKFRVDCKYILVEFTSANIFPDTSVRPLVT